MAITATVLQKFNAPGNNAYDFSITFDSVYAATSGEAWDLSTVTLFPNKVLGAFELQKADGLVVQFAPGTAGGPTNCTLQVWQGDSAGNTLIPCTTGTDLSGVSCRLRVSGY